MFRRIVQNTIILSALAGFIFLGAWLNFIMSPLVTLPSGQRYELKAGLGFKGFTADLVRQGILKHPLFFKFLADLRPSSHELKAGVYLFPKGTTPGRLLTQVTQGKGLLYHVFTIVPGWTFQQLREALAKAPYLKTTLGSLSEAELIKRLALTETSLEGQFYPDSYFYLENSTDFNLLTRAHQRLRLKLNDAWATRELASPYKTPYEALIAASLVEKESRLNAERPVIAGVIINRLAKKMPLQLDPTVHYAVQQAGIKDPKLAYSGPLRKHDLKINSPYNSYVHQGLPPTPIALPSYSALTAVLHPLHHAYLYFVASGGGGHQFSATFEEHQLAVLLLRFREQGFFNYQQVEALLAQRLVFKKWELPDVLR